MSVIGTFSDKNTDNKVTFVNMTVGTVYRSNEKGWMNTLVIKLSSTDDHVYYVSRPYPTVVGKVSGMRESSSHVEFYTVPGDEIKFGV